MKSNKQQPSFNLKRICAICIAVYVALVICADSAGGRTIS